MPVVTIDGQPLHYLDQGEGEVVVLGSSYLWDSAMWAAQISVLSQHYRVIVPELWGHGQSGRLPENTRNLDDLANQVLALLDRLDIQRFSLVGLSVGGMWGARLALAAPQRIRGLVLMDTYAGAEPEATRQYYFSMLKMIEDAGSIPPPLLDAIVPIFFKSGIDPETPFYQAFRHSLTRYSREQLLDSIVPLGRLIFGRDDRLAALAALPAETTLVLCGEQDKPRPPSEAREMAEIIGCPYIGIPEAGHISSVENPACVNQALLAFLEKLPG
ncbi:alpha/beta fold hydrolase [Pseudomonas fuscovaginae UPB0736]|uniref:alpha/beta fold hydrolase n=1 Tax=Pseudomonas asplenii TaxID=53407 RepID=UPI000289083A|nr:alpha/beta fold hydrolase [Pseudomonas fuscovaginae]UUQ67579.1 alpha/beta fold hydrolase [Pseudomonas fuscovaginae UPB0736]